MYNVEVFDVTLDSIVAGVDCFLYSKNLNNSIFLYQTNLFIPYTCIFSHFYNICRGGQEQDQPGEVPTNSLRLYAAQAC